MTVTAPPRLWAPFASRNYRFLWPADLATSMAIEMEMLILGWYVLVTTESVFLLTVLGALHYIGTLLAPGIGVIADRIGLRNMLCLMRLSYAVLAGVLAFLFVTEQVTIPLICAVAALLGAVRPSDMGMRNALVAQIISAQQLSGALAISRMTLDMSRIFGALSGAGLFAAFGAAQAYLVVTAAYLIGFVLTAAISLRKQELTGNGRRSPIGDLLAGLAYVWRTPHIQASMWMACLANLTAFPQAIGLLPYVAKNVYGIDETGLGFLMASFAVGALVGSFVLVVLRDRVTSGRLMIVSSVFWHLFMLAFAFTTTSAQGMALLCAAGFAQSLSMLSLMSLILKTSDPTMLGRVMGVRMLAIYTLPLGLMTAGVLIPRIGFAATAAGYAVTGIVLTLAIAIRWHRSIWLASAPANA